MIKIKDVNSSEHFDLNRIIENSNGDFIFLNDIYSEFLLELPKKMAAIQASLKENKIEDVLNICHNLIGIFPIFGMESSVHILRDIKLQLHQNGIDNSIQKQFEELELILNKVLLEIEIELSKLS
jgi:HPt (histidine-containing phosphotransfer) domain-containing protein